MHKQSAIETKVQKRIRAIACDIDGTLLNSDKRSIHPKSLKETLRAIEHARRKKNEQNEQNRWFFLATGRPRQAALSSLDHTPTLGPIAAKLPGVFMQGLYCVDENNQVVFEQRLKAETIEVVERVAVECDCSVAILNGNTVVTTKRSRPIQDMLERFGDPKLIVVDRLALEYGKKHGAHKVIILDQNISKLQHQVRPRLEEELLVLAKNSNSNTIETLTSGNPTILEVLPAGCSKANGVKRLCEHFGIDPAMELLAIGDAENDAELLEMAAIGVAVGNACCKAKEAANVELKETNDEGAVGVALQLLLYAEGGGGYYYEKLAGMGCNE